MADLTGKCVSKSDGSTKSNTGHTRACMHTHTTHAPHTPHTHTTHHTEVEMRFCGCAVICPSTPDLVQSQTLYMSTYFSFCSVIYILSGRLELCLLGSIGFFTTLLCTVDARQMGYKSEQFQSPRMHSSVTTGNSNTVQGNKANFLGTGSKIAVHKHATPTQVKAVV